MHRAQARDGWTQSGGGRGGAREHWGLRTHSLPAFQAFCFCFCYSISSSVLHPYIFTSSFLTLLDLPYIFLVSSPFPSLCICMFHICASSDCIYFGAAYTLHIPVIIYSRSCLANLIPILKFLLSPRLSDCCGLLTLPRGVLNKLY
jgi:hypothetical protein